MAEPIQKRAKQNSSFSKMRTWRLNPVLDPEFTNDLPLREVYVGTIKEKRNISTVIQCISSILPLFGHLKRCRGCKLLLVPVEDSDQSTKKSPTDVKNLLSERGFDVNLLENEFEIVKVPSTRPRTKIQATRVSKIWPVNFHPDPYIESVVSGSIFNDKQLGLIEGYMRLAVDAAKLNISGSEECNGSAVIVDPEDGRILAVACSSFDQHPLWHASMLAIDLVARLQGEGAWNLENKTRRKFDLVADSLSEFSPRIADKTDQNHVGAIATTFNYDDKSKYSIGEQQIKMMTDPFTDSVNENFETRAKNIKRKYANEAPLFYPFSLSQLNLPAQESLISDTRKQKNKKTEISLETQTMSSEKKTGPYICTGYYIFLLQEPCSMCSMALLHSRISKVFYATSNPLFGVLGSKAALHTLPGLNHRYEVWSGILEEEARIVMKI